MKALFLSLLVLSSLSAFAKDCQDEMSTYDIYSCEAAKLKVEDARLNANYKSLMAKLDIIGKGKLKAAQRAWITFKDADCTYQADEMRDGSFAKVLLVSCLSSMTKERADALQDGVEFR